MNWPCGEFWPVAPGIPMPAGTCRGEPFTNRVRCAWMWNRVCSLVSQPMPSTFWPVAFVAVPVSGGPLGMGAPSGPVVPAAGAGLSVLPSVLSAASLSEGVPPVLLLDEPPEVATIVMPTAAATTITAPPAAASQRCLRLRRVSAALACAIFSRACCCLFLLPLDTAPFPRSGHRLVAGRRAAACTESRYLRSTYVDRSMMVEVLETVAGT